MVDINGYEISKAFTGGEPVSAIYSFGEKVWPTGPEPITWGGLKFTALETGTIGMSHYGTNANTTKPRFDYSKDGVNWTRWDYSTISVNKGDVICFKGNNGSISKSSKNYSIFSLTGKIAASGNIMSLLYGYDFEGKLSLVGKDYCFTKLFYKCKGLVTTPSLPATTLEDYCYQNMFSNCTSLTTTPSLPATTLAYECYSYMFKNCTSLVEAPELHSTTLAPWCYYHMFNGCKLLTTTPSLPATELEFYCYGYMFQGCTSLTSAPELPATELVNNCYDGMFYGCTNLNYVKAEFITEPNNSYTYYWLYGVASTGTFVANPSATWTTTIERNDTTVPSGWTIQK